MASVPMELAIAQAAIGEGLLVLPQCGPRVMDYSLPARTHHWRTTNFRVEAAPAGNGILYRCDASLC
jgi:hypothetical protein